MGQFAMHELEYRRVPDRVERPLIGNPINATLRWSSPDRFPIRSPGSVGAVDRPFRCRVVGRRCGGSVDGAACGVVRFGRPRSALCPESCSLTRPSSEPDGRGDPSHKPAVGLRNKGVSRFVGDRPGEFPPRTQGEVLVTVQLVRMVVTTWLANRSDRGATASSVFDREARTSSGFRREAHI
jgi:hypothetical protein